MPEAARSAALAVIPARGGSKRIPRKNIRPFAGVPLLARTIALVREAGVFERVIVSTDDDEIAAVAAGAGAQVPFRRPHELADDMTGTLPVVAHAVRAMEALGGCPPLVCCVYPAAVLAAPEDFRAALRMLEEPGVDYAFTSASFGYPIQRSLRRTASGGCEMFWPRHRETRSQDLEPAFHDAGQFYFGRREAWLEQRALFGARSRMLVLPRHRVQDIDTAEDWQRAEFLFDWLQRERRA